jgi:dodecin
MRSATLRKGVMLEKTYKIIEVVGVSDSSIHEAVGDAITKATQTLHNIDWFEVSNIRGAVHQGEIDFQVEVRIGFRLEGDPV